MFRLVIALLLIYAVSCAAGPTGKIIFTSNRDGNGEICAVNADGTGLTNLTNHTAYDDQPAVSPDGKEVVFVSDRDGNRELYLMDLAKRSVVRLTNTAESEVDPVFTADATAVLYTTDTGGSRDIYKLDLSTGEATPVCAGVNDEYMPYQGPGGKLVYAEKIAGDDEVMLLASDGTKRLTSSPGVDFMPTISADGKKVFFVTTREGDYDLYVMYADGTGQKPLVNTENTEGRGAPSPDGAYVVVPIEDGGSLDLFIYDMEGERVSQLTADAYDNYEPCWSK